MKRLRPRTAKQRRHTLATVTQRPVPFEHEELLFWSDSYVSRNILDAHLSRRSDAASRKPETIELSTVWMNEQFDTHNRIDLESIDRKRLLDIGCGPGLYAARFQTLGFHVTGIDASPASVAYAKENCRLSDASAEFVHADYTKWKPPEKRFAAVTCIYGGMGTISDAKQHRLLETLFHALVPGGMLIFDAFTEEYVEEERVSRSWHYVDRNGFWSDRPHILLENSYLYPDVHAFANSYTVLFANGLKKRHVVWHRYYTKTELQQRLAEHGYEIVATYADLCGTPWYGSSRWIGVIARRPAESTS